MPTIVRACRPRSARITENGAIALVRGFASAARLRKTNS